GVHREDRLSHPGRTDAVNPVLVNRYPSSISIGLRALVTIIQPPGEYLQQIKNNLPNLLNNLFEKG
ncbi:hypothetical protein, partial [Aeromonas sp. QDB68]|uniref:hypothetical protein n=1 Tax=Aeromonas sp. QDB68 TaxID=2989823 RepID=UPI0022E4ED17